MLGHVEMKHSTPTVTEHHQDEQNPILDPRDGEEVVRDQVAHVVGQEGSPSLGRRLISPSKAPVKRSLPRTSVQRSKGRFVVRTRLILS